MPVLRKSTRSNPRIQARLQEVAGRLQAVQSAVAVAVAALRAQNADIDEDVARLLVRSVADPLHEQVDSINWVLRELRGTRRPALKVRRTGRTRRNTAGGRR